MFSAAAFFSLLFDLIQVCLIIILLKSKDHSFKIIMSLQQALSGGGGVATFLLRRGRGCSARMHCSSVGTLCVFWCSCASPSLWGFASSWGGRTFASIVRCTQRTICALQKTLFGKTSSQGPSGPCRPRSSKLPKKTSHRQHSQPEIYPEKISWEGAARQKTAESQPSL